MSEVNSKSPKGIQHSCPFVAKCCLHHVYSKVGQQDVWSNQCLRMNVDKGKKDAIVATAESLNLLVFSILRESRCSECNRQLCKGNFLFKEGERGLCMNCADLD